MILIKHFLGLMYISFLNSIAYPFLMLVYRHLTPISIPPLATSSSRTKTRKILKDKSNFIPSSFGKGLDDDINIIFRLFTPNSLFHQRASGEINVNVFLLFELCTVLCTFMYLCNINRVFPLHVGEAWRSIRILHTYINTHTQTRIHKVVMIQHLKKKRGLIS